MRKELFIRFDLQLVLFLQATARRCIQFVHGPSRPQLRSNASHNMVARRLVAPDPATADQ